MTFEEWAKGVAPDITLSAATLLLTQAAWDAATAAERARCVKACEAVRDDYRDREEAFEGLPEWVAAECLGRIDRPCPTPGCGWFWQEYDGRRFCDRCGKWFEGDTNTKGGGR